MNSKFWPAVVGITAAASILYWEYRGRHMAQPETIVVVVPEREPAQDAVSQPSVPARKAACQPNHGFDDRTLGEIYLLASVGRAYNDERALIIADGLLPIPPHDVLDEGIRLLQRAGMDAVGIIETLGVIASAARQDGDLAMADLIDRHALLLLMSAAPEQAHNPSRTADDLY